MLKRHQYKLTREEVIEAVSLWLREKRGNEVTPETATTPDDTIVFVKTPTASGMNAKTLRVQKGMPLCVEWDVLDGEGP